MTTNRLDEANTQDFIVYLYSMQKKNIYILFQVQQMGKKRISFIEG